jgi:uncharacterized membrane protein
MNLKQLVISGVMMLLLDSIYLSTFSNFFNKVVEKVQGTKIQLNLSGAILCYLFLIFGINYFILDQKKSLTDAFILGLVIYGVYETTSFTLLKNWSFNAVLLDTLWGGILFTLTVYLTRKTIRFLN